jgi:lysophospholipase L1-like esterase
MEWYEAEVLELERSVARQGPFENAVAFYGSSTIRLWDTLAQDLANLRAVNLGFGGSTLEACVYFFERLVPVVKPCSLVVYAGDNDLGDGHSPGDVFGMFRALTAKVNQQLDGIEFGFISIKPSPARFGIIDKIRRANELIRNEIESTQRGYFIDVFEAMLDGDGRPRWELFLEDGLHMSRAGYRLWVELLSPFRNRIFTEKCH